MTSSGRGPPDRNMLDFNPFKLLGVTAAITDEELEETFDEKFTWATYAGKVKGRELLTARLIQAYTLLKDADPRRRLELEMAYSGKAPEHSLKPSSSKKMKVLSEEDKPMLPNGSELVIQEGSIFPSLIWDMILGEVEDSKDIANVVIAIPELAPLVRTKAHKWRFGEVAPTLIQYLNLEDILACRLVSTRWSRGMDQFLESNSDAFHEHGGIEVGTKATGSSYPPDCFRGVKTFNTPGMITKFIQDMKGHPPSRNPFLGRQISLAPEVVTGIGLRHFWDVAQQLLDKFGEHVWHIQFNCPIVAENRTSLCQSVLNSFQHLPNLKLLSLGCDQHLTTFTDDFDLWDYGELAVKAVNEFKESGLTVQTPPPNLDSLWIRTVSYPQPLLNFLLKWLSANLRKLTLKIEPEITRDFLKIVSPNLNDLSVGGYISKNDFLLIFQNLDAPQVSKLGLELLEKDTEYMMGLHIFPLLKKFENLGHLTLKCCGESTMIDEEDEISAATLSMPSLKSLTVSSNCSNLPYNFLLSFPSLEKLEIDCIYDYEYDSDVQPELELRRNESRPGPTVRLAEFLRNGRIYESNVWKLLPHLREITVWSPPVGSALSTYSRDKVIFDN